MNKNYFKNSIWQMIFIIVNSAFAVFFLNSLAFGFSFETLFNSVLHTIIIGSSVCLGILLIIPKIRNFSLLERFSIVSLTIFITTFFGVFLTRICLGIYYQKPFGMFYLPGYRTIVFSLIISATFGFTAYFYITSQNTLEEAKEKLRQKELDEEKVKSLAVQAQLAALESRIHPHFLFNTLNSIAALIKENPDEAEKMVEKLSALLRYSLDENAKGTVSLEKELEITEKYLEIEKARFAERLNYKIVPGENAENINVPPLSLQTLVENSIKHVASKSSKKTEITIAAFSNGANFIIEVKDNGAGFSAAELKKGHGLDNLNKRLKNIFGEKADLEITNGAGGNVRLKIPFINV